MEPWHALFAPLPAGAVPVLAPVGSPEVLASAAGAAIAGWTRLTLNLSDPCHGLRIVLVVRDADGVVLSASDAVVYRREAGARLHFRHETLGGRFEADGAFAGRHWTAESIEMADGETAAGDPASGREPSAAEVESLRALVAEIIRRAG
jgi:hypothetical protein